MSSAFDYRELNKRNVKDSYPLPLLDEVQDRLHEAFQLLTSKMVINNYQLVRCHKTAFSLGP